MFILHVTNILVEHRRRITEFVSVVYECRKTKKLEVSHTRQRDIRTGVRETLKLKNTQNSGVKDAANARGAQQTCTRSDEIFSLEETDTAKRSTRHDEKQLYCTLDRGQEYSRARAFLRQSRRPLGAIVFFTSSVLTPPPSSTCTHLSPRACSQ